MPHLRKSVLQKGGTLNFEPVADRCKHLAQLGSCTVAIRWVDGWRQAGLVEVEWDRRLQSRMQHAHACLPSVARAARAAAFDHNRKVQCRQRRPHLRLVRSAACFAVLPWLLRPLAPPAWPAQLPLPPAERVG